MLHKNPIGSLNPNQKNNETVCHPVHPTFQVSLSTQKAV